MLNLEQIKEQKNIFIKILNLRIYILNIIYIHYKISIKL